MRHQMPLARPIHFPEANAPMTPFQLSFALAQKGRAGFRPGDALDAGRPAGAAGIASARPIPGEGCQPLLGGSR